MDSVRQDKIKGKAKGNGCQQQRREAAKSMKSKKVKGYDQGEQHDDGGEPQLPIKLDNKGRIIILQLNSVMTIKQVHGILASSIGKVIQNISNDRIETIGKGSP